MHQGIVALVNVDLTFPLISSDCCFVQIHFTGAEFDEILGRKTASAAAVTEQSRHVGKFGNERGTLGNMPLETCEVWNERLGREAGEWLLFVKNSVRENNR